MRKKEKQVVGKEKIDGIIKDANSMHLGMCEDMKPYVVPLNFGYDGKDFYIHCAKEGKKIDILKTNPNVWIEITSKQDIVGSDLGCDWTCDYTSVMGKGQVQFLKSPDEKRAGLACIMEKYSPGKQYSYPDGMINGVCIIKIEVDELIGKSANPV